MKKIILIMVCVFFVNISLAHASLDEDAAGWEWLSGGAYLNAPHGVPTTNWYDVSQWEIDVCFDWGGLDASTEYSSDTVVVDYYHNLIVTLQAEKSDPFSMDGVEADNSIYEVAWFIQPSDIDETINWEVSIIDDRGVRTQVDVGAANYVNGISGYEIKEGTTNYVKAIISWENQYRSDALEVYFQE